MILGVGLEVVYGSGCSDGFRKKFEDHKDGGRSGKVYMAVDGKGLDSCTSRVFTTCRLS